MFIYFCICFSCWISSGQHLQNFRPPLQLQQICRQDCLDTPPMDRDSGDRAHDGDVFWDLDIPCMGLPRDVEGLSRRYKMCHGYKSIVWHSWRLRWQGGDDWFPQTNSIDHIVKHGTRRYPHGSSRFESHYLKATKFDNWETDSSNSVWFRVEMEPLEIYEVTAF